MEDSLVQRALLAAPRRHLTEAFLRSVMEQESRSRAYFTKDEHQYQKNMKVAMDTLGMTEAEVLALVTLPGGRIAKFRLEPREYHKLKWNHLSKDKRFYMSSSWGLGQVMGYNLLQKVKEANYKSTIKSFAADEYAQLKWTADELDRLLIKAKGDQFIAYARYNGGGKGENNPAPRARAKEVIDRL